MWRAFVYSQDDAEDRAKQAYNEFKPLDGKFARQCHRAGEERRDRLPAARALPSAVRRDAEDAADDGVPDHQGISRLRHAPRLSRPDVRGGAAQPTPARSGKGIDRRQGDRRRARTATRSPASPASPISAPTATGAARTSTRPTGTPSAAWRGIRTSRRATSRAEWVAADLRDRSGVVTPIVEMMMGSREAVVDYMTPLGLHHLMATGHHYGPGALGRTTSRAPTGTRPITTRPTRTGIGFDRTATGSNAVAQYAPELARASPIRRPRPSRTCCGSTTVAGTSACRRAGRCGRSWSRATTAASSRSGDAPRSGRRSGAISTRAPSRGRAPSSPSRSARRSGGATPASPISAIVSAAADAARVRQAAASRSTEYKRGRFPYAPGR